MQLKIIQEKQKRLHVEITSIEDRILAEEQAEGHLQRSANFLEALQKKIADPAIWDWELKRSCVQIILAGGQVIPPSVPGGQPSIKLLFDFLPDAVMEIRSRENLYRGLIQEIIEIFDYDA
jgi:hypothetical protein